MNTPLADINILRQKITDETIKALGLSPSDFVRKFISPIVFPATHQFAKLAAHFDHYVAKFGFSEAARWVLPRFVKDLTIIGADNVPEEGPLLVVSNHPGTVDVLAIAAGLSRDDIKIVSSAIPFIKHLPNTAQHLIFTTIDTHERMAVIRTIIRSLEEGRALLIFPSGGVDPDPAFMPEAIDSINNWSPSIELILRKVPKARLLITVVKGVLYPSFIKHPLLVLRKRLRDRQRLAEFLQVIHQMVFPGSIMLSPKVIFDRPLEKSELPNKDAPMEVMRSIVNRARAFFRSQLDINSL